MLGCDGAGQGLTNLPAWHQCDLQKRFVLTSTGMELANNSTHSSWKPGGLLASAGPGLERQAVLEAGAHWELPACLGPLPFCHP